MTHWSDQYTDEQIKQLKANTTPFGLCAGWKREAFVAMPQGDRLVYAGEARGWRNAEMGAPLSVDTNRLSPLFQRPEKEDEPELPEGCGISIDEFSCWATPKQMYSGPMVVPSAQSVNEALLNLHRHHTEREAELQARVEKLEQHSHILLSGDMEAVSPPQYFDGKPKLEGKR